jgi:hypothetical protein
MVDKYQTLLNFPDQNASVQLIYAVVSAFPNFFPIFLFLFWIFMTASGYFVALKTTGLRRYWQYSTAISFICFLFSLFLVSMNGIANGIQVTVLSPYWIAFYILVTAISWYGLRQYK